MVVIFAPHCYNEVNEDVNSDDKTMITAGIDIGIKTTKVVLLNDDKILAQSCVLTGWEPQQAGESALSAAPAKICARKQKVVAGGTSSRIRISTGALLHSD